MVPKRPSVENRLKDEINALLKKLSSKTAPVIAGFHENTAEILEPSDIIRIYASAGKVFAVTVQGKYLLHLRLYELEERLPHRLPDALDQTQCFRRQPVFRNILCYLPLYLAVSILGHKKACDADERKSAERRSGPLTAADSSFSPYTYLSRRLQIYPVLKRQIYRLTVFIYCRYASPNVSRLTPALSGAVMDHHIGFRFLLSRSSPSGKRLLPTSFR